jgi:hypothetical protein
MAGRQPQHGRYSGVDKGPGRFEIVTDFTARGSADGRIKRDKMPAIYFLTCISPLVASELTC